MDATQTAMDRDITADVIASVAAMIRQAPDTITGRTRLHQDLDFDSTNVLELLMRLEADFDIEFDPDTFGTTAFETVDSLAAYVRQTLGK
ncbi:acyl carrier protein (plasmid) [Streptomyces sp. NBC_00868]|uniref:acyl carrier protein n=1 Tax=Streptomyces sp. NBC_00868 TaxID=2903683 RepID=UPI002F911B8C|nr:acyl carrier protein [Streptomyces sp. NBC_00868]